MKDKIGIIGFGNMGSALGEQFKTKYDILVFDQDSHKTKNLAGIDVADNATDLINKVDIVILAVKPQDLGNLLEEIKNFMKGKLIISIAAGITTDRIEKYLVNARVIRVMPNLPARIAKGMICLCRGKSAEQEDLSFAEELFNNLGNTLVLDEAMMDAATAISGSGPGYLYDWAEGKNIEEIKKYAKDVFIPALTRAAQSIGFAPRQAQALAKVTVEGSIDFLEKTKLSTLELKKQVTSKGGTTEAGLKVLQAGGTLVEAVKVALKRAQELSREL